jgi:ATP-dependent exoDNAse (exonuclease V) alpha subunit
MVLDIVVKYARDLRKAENLQKKPPKPPHLMVHGGAGAGKSTVIDVLARQFERIMRRPGDDGDHPYVIKCAPTGTAACSIEGRTYHSALHVIPDTVDFHGLSDKTRMEAKQELKNMKILVMDEVSMVAADVLYVIDLRLKEIKENNKDPFGGVMMVILGDVMQLPPVKARLVFEEPNKECYQLMHKISPLWEMCTVITLEENHRQAEDKDYADLLNRLRVGDMTEYDIAQLEKRVRPNNHPDIENVDMLVAGTKAIVHQKNKMCLKKINTQEITLKAKYLSELQKKCAPNITPLGEIKGTGYQDLLVLKIGCKLMMIENVHVSDGLSNGSLGELKYVIREKDGEIHTLMIQFKMANAGKKWRKDNPNMAAKYPGCTGVKRFMRPVSKMKKKIIIPWI